MDSAGTLDLSGNGIDQLEMLYSEFCRGDLVMDEEIVARKIVQRSTRFWREEEEEEEKCAQEKQEREREICYY